ncbi:MAG: aminoglycoside phosphotransferase family protein [Planctomycetales bacterium]|nr:aminoglycoside phosphotransferase family protein [Planctomycetales bacterium]
MVIPQFATKNRTSLARDDHSMNIVPSAAFLDDSWLRLYRVTPLEPVVGGFSRSTVWKCNTAEGVAALKAWPVENDRRQELANRLRLIHHAMKVAREDGGLSFVPRVFTAFGNESLVFADGAIWELIGWMEGTASYVHQPSTEKLTAAMHALGRLHSVWNQHFPLAEHGPSLAIQDRIKKLETWTAATRNREYIELMRSKFNNALEVDLAEQTLHAVRLLGGQFQRQLGDLAKQTVPQHLVLRDIWSGHVLFQQERLAGLIDFGASRFDEPSTDVARLLGSLEPCDPARWHAGLSVYQETSHVPVEPARVYVLDQSSTLLAACQWLEWLSSSPHSFEDKRPQAIARWAMHCQRLRLWFP